jgi:hypothetical protein
MPTAYRSAANQLSIWRIIMLRLVLSLVLLICTFTADAGQCASQINQMENIGELKKILHCLDQQARDPATVNPRSFVKSTVKTKSTVERYLFEAEYCRRTNTSTHTNAGEVSCAVVLTNKGKTVYSPDLRQFGIYTADSHFYDEYGHEYSALTSQMGKVVIEAQGQSNRKNFKDGYLEKYMPLGIPMRLILTFSDVTSETTTVMALNIKFSYRDKKGLGASFVTLEGIAITH